MTKTDVPNRALRIAKVVHELAPDGSLRVVRADGTSVEVFFL